VMEGRLYLSMEYVDGPSLERIAAGGSRPSVVETLRIARQVVDGLAYAHGRKIVHRALSPSNILRSTSGLVKIVDFGLARPLSANPRAARLLGASPYRAPEQELGMEPDPRSDVYAAGAILYEMLTGQRPSRTARPQRPRELQPAIPEVLDAVVMRALDPDPAERFPTAADLGKPIRRILEQVDQRVTAMAKAGPTGESGGSIASLRDARARRQAKK